MSGVGRWVKKHPLETLGILAAGATGGASLGLFGAASAAAPAIAPAIAAGEAGLGSALALEAGGGAVGAMSPVAMEAMGSPMVGSLAPSFGSSLMSGIDKMAPYAKVSNQGMGLLAQNDQPQMPVAQPQGYRGPGPQLPMPGIYDDPDLKKRMAMMAQTGRFYG